MEDEERPLYEMPETTKPTFLFKGGDSRREAKGQWSPKVKACIREHEAELIWAKRSAGTWAEKINNREEVGRKELGEAIRTTMRRMGGDEMDKKPDTALLPSGKYVHEVEDESGRQLPLRGSIRKKHEQ